MFAAASQSAAALLRSSRGPMRRLCPLPAAAVPAASFSAAVVASLGMGDVAEPLAFVNREAELLDILVPNLSNHEFLRRNVNVKFNTTLAAQAPGTGKTSLGRNITAILRRPREADAETEAVVAARLSTAQCWTRASADRALRDPRDENLVLRTLLAKFPHHEATIMKLKQVNPLVIEMTALGMPDDTSFRADTALAFAIFCAARGLDASNPSAKAAFVAENIVTQMPNGAVRAFMSLNGGAPVVLVLEDIHELQSERYAEYFRGSNMQRVMSSLRLELQLLHDIPGCFVYCTGRCLWRSMAALADDGPQLWVRSVLLQPLTADEVVESVRLTTDAAGWTLLDSLGVAAGLVHFFAAQVVEMTGGAARSVQLVVRARQREFDETARILTTQEEVRAAVDGLLPRIVHIPDAQFRVNWDGPAAAVAAKEIPPWTQRTAAQVLLLQLFARMLLLDAPFDPALIIRTPPDYEILRLGDATFVLGFSYVPVADGMTVRLNAGMWLCRSLLTEPHIMGNPAALASVQLLVAIRSSGGSMRGRPYEMLCADALLHRSLVSPGATLATLLPHLRPSARASDVVSGLRVVALPRVVITPDVTRLDSATQASLLCTPEFWTGPATIHTDDLPWLLSTWLPVDSLGVPADASSSSQDLFLRVSGGVIGIAIKAATTGTTWSDVREQLTKVPTLTDTPYSVVLWSTSLAPELQAAVGSAEAGVFKEGEWFLRDEALVQRDSQSAASEAAPAFKVPPSVQELIIDNLKAPLGGGLQQLLGGNFMEPLQCMNEEARESTWGSPRSAGTRLIERMAEAIARESTAGAAIIK